MLVPDLLLQLVKVVRQGRHLHFQALPLTDAQDQLLHLAALLQAVARQTLPVVEDALRECLTTGSLSQGSNKTERLRDRQVRFHLDQRRALSGVLLKDASSPQVHAVVDTTHGLLWARDLNQEDRFLKSWLGSELSCKAASSCGRHDLPCTAVDGISVQGHIHEVEADASHVLLAQRSFLGGPLERAVHMLLDLDEVLNAHRGVHD
mmetsp:Transcript_42539/g.101387  ORF Transcript_42539/g.101387 Transcript_42539/m.101387 type:complete len:206 (+) Transcript_42539:45-662(+)